MKILICYELEIEGHPPSAGHAFVTVFWMSEEALNIAGKKIKDDIQLKNPAVKITQLVFRSISRIVE